MRKCCYALHIGRLQRDIRSRGTTSERRTPTGSQWFSPRLIYASAISQCKAYQYFCTRWWQVVVLRVHRRKRREAPVLGWLPTDVQVIEINTWNCGGLNTRAVMHMVYFIFCSDQESNCYPFCASPQTPSRYPCSNAVQTFQNS